MVRGKKGRPVKERLPGDNGKPNKSYDFTDNQLFDQATGEPIPERLAFWQKLAREQDGDGLMKIMIARERAPTTGRWHGQGRLTFRMAHRWKFVNDILPPLWFEDTKAIGDWCYFLKYDTTLILDIDNRKQGKRHIFAEQVEAIKNGANLRDCIEMEGANYQSMRAAELKLKYIEPPRPPGPREVTPIPAFEPPMDAYALTNKWFDGYDAHDTICIDQRLCQFSAIELRRICGYHCFRLPRTGRQARWNKVLIYGCSPNELAELGLDAPGPHSAWAMFQYNRHRQI